MVVIAPLAMRRAYLALWDVIHVDGEGTKDALGVLPLVGVVAVVEHVAQLLQLSQGLRHRPPFFPSSLSLSSRIDAQPLLLSGTLSDVSVGRRSPERCTRERLRAVVFHALRFQPRASLSGGSFEGKEWEQRSDAAADFCQKKPRRSYKKNTLLHARVSCARRLRKPG